jgi:hypothetical protein
VIPPCGNAGASAQLGAHQQPYPGLGEACKATVTCSPEVLLIWNRPSLMPGYHSRNESQSGETVFGETALTGWAVSPLEVPSHRSRPPVP